jgi:2-dehydro-3-deoxygluconokinase
MKTFIFGEAMLEYHSNGGEGLRYGGDTLNTAMHLARAGHEVVYVTAVGTDPISDALVEAWTREGIDTSHVLRHPTRNPGIYAIHLDEQGERSFLYWRDRSAAREMFDLPGIQDALEAAREAVLVYFSLISLAIAEGEGRAKLLELAAFRKASGKAVAYDSNFRPALWPSLSIAENISQNAMGACTIGLPTNSDERDLWRSDAGEPEIARRWLAAGCETVAVKAAEKGCVLATSVSPAPKLIGAEQTAVVDSSGAGDAFNGGFLGAWLAGRCTEDCVEAGQALARKTLGHQGAIAF